MASEFNGLTTDAVPQAPRKTILSPKLIENDSEKCQVDKNKNINVNTDTQETIKTPVESSTRNAEGGQAHAKHSKKKAQSKNAKSPNTNIFVVHSKQVHVGTVNNYNYSNSDAESKNKTDESGIPFTPEIRRVLNSENKANQSHYEVVAEHLGLAWRNIGLQLGYSNGQLDRFYEDNKSCGLKEVIYQMLLDWTREAADQATVGHLATVLWDSKQKFIVQKLVTLM